MKKSVFMALAAATLVLASCNDMLEQNPRDRFVNSPEFWSNANQVESYSNALYENFSGYGYGGNGGWFYFKSLSDDQANPEFDNWTFTSVPQSSSYWSGAYTEIRRANYLIQGMASSSLDEATRDRYMAIGRLSRAWQYFQLVRMYGDVVWLDHVVTDPNNAADVKAPRTDRDEVMDKVLEDLDYAIGHLPSTTDKTVWSKQLAQAMKSDVCLFEGTYCKYRTAEANGKAAAAARATKYLQECVNVSKDVMGGYSLNDDYQTIYNSLSLSSNPEAIFIRKYAKDVQGHSTVDYTTGSTAQRGVTKDAVNAFLFLDGKPLATTSLDKSDAPELNADGHYDLTKMLSVRDKRLSVIIDSICCFKGHGWARAAELAEMTASTAYTIHKFDTDKMEGDQNYYRNQIGTAYTDAPIFWLAVVYLNYTEATAELGSPDLQYINKLQARAGLPDLVVNPAADPANNHGVSNLLWEIRRSRRCELMIDNWYRYWDLVRWHQLDKLDSSRYPDINRGANLSVVTDCEVDLDADGYVIPTAKTRTFDNKYYFYPIPNEQVTLSGCSQNKGW